MKISLVFSCKVFGNLLKRSPTEMIMFALTPKSILDFKRLKIKSMFSWQIFEETHINLQSARMADLSRIQSVGISSPRSYLEYF